MVCCRCTKPRARRRHACNIVDHNYLCRLNPRHGATLESDEYTDSVRLRLGCAGPTEPWPALPARPAFWTRAPRTSPAACWSVQLQRSRNPSPRCLARSPLRLCVVLTAPMRLAALVGNAFRGHKKLSPVLNPSGLLVCPCPFAHVSRRPPAAARWAPLSPAPIARDLSVAFDVAPSIASVPPATSSPPRSGSPALRRAAEARLLASQRPGLGLWPRGLMLLFCSSGSAQPFRHAQAMASALDTELDTNFGWSKHIDSAHAPASASASAQPADLIGTWARVTHYARLLCVAPLSCGLATRSQPPKTMSTTRETVCSRFVRIIAWRPCCSLTWR